MHGRLRASRRSSPPQPTIHRLIGEGVLPDGYASDNGTGLIGEDTELVDCVTETEGSRTWRMSRCPDETVEETALPTRLPPS